MPSLMTLPAVHFHGSPVSYRLRLFDASVLHLHNAVVQNELYGKQSSDLTPCFFIDIADF